MAVETTRPSTAINFSSWARFRIPASIVSLVRFAERRGLPAHACLASTGLDAEGFYAGTASITDAQEITIIRNILRHFGDGGGLGVHAGRPESLGVLGAWGLRLFHSAKMRDIVQPSLRYGHQKLSWELTPTIVVPFDGGLRIVHDTMNLPRDVRRFLIEREFAFKLSMLSFLTDEVTPLRIECTLDASEGSELTEAFPEHEFLFRAVRDAVVVDNELLDRPLPHADADAARYCEWQCEMILSATSGRSGVADAVREEVARIRPGRASLNAIAATRHVDVRTLRRQLASEGVSYRELVEDVGRRLTLELFTKTELSIEDIAERVGYADAASFSRAFRRWTGGTPGAERAQLRIA